MAIAVVMTGSVAVRQALSKEIARNRAYYLVEAASQGFSDRALTDLMAGAGPGAVWIAAAHNPDAPQRAWKRPDGWKRLDIDTVPTLQLGRLTMADAERINSVIPDSPLDSPPTEPFVLRASGPERARAVRCMTAAIYYEAALEPRAGQEAVAQVVLNRMRHAGYPKSVCGVVFQGSDRPGCQFSFACDGSMGPAAGGLGVERGRGRRQARARRLRDEGRGHRDPLPTPPGSWRPGRRPWSRCARSARRSSSAPPGRRASRPPSPSATSGARAASPPWT
ncbi:MAG: cell wall hydrolase [Caulobacteraceae bacterium]